MCFVGQVAHGKRSPGATENMRNTFFVLKKMEYGTVVKCFVFFVGAKLEDIPGKCGKVEVFLFSPGVFFFGVCMAELCEVDMFQIFL